MNLFALSGLLAGITSSVMAVFMFVRGRNKLHYIWGIFCISVAFWGFGGYKVATTQDIVETDMWWRITHIGVIFIPILFTHFVYQFLKIKNKWLIISIYTAGVIFLTTNFINGLFIANMRWVFNQFYYDSPPGPFYIPFTVLFFGLIIFSHIKLWQTLRVSSGIEKTQIKYFFTATLIGFVGGGFSFLPVYKIDLYPFFNISVFLYPLIMGYAILKYRLMDIRIVARRFFIYFGVAAFTYGIFYLVAWIYTSLFGGVFSPTGYLSGIIIAPIFVAAFYGVNKGLKIIANKYLFYTLYNYQETISKLADELNKSIDLNKIVGSIVETVKQTMQLDKAGVLLVNRKDGIIRYEITKVIGFNEKNGISLVQDNFLTRHLEKTQKLLVRDELVLLARDAKILQDKQSFEQLYQNMKQIEASLCLPIISSNKLIGIIVLGAKISDDAYSKEDLELLITLSKQAGIAIENARLYTEVQDLSQNLQQKVDEQTKEIRKAYEVEKKARKELERLNRAKDQFILATQHHLRTPLTSTQGYLDLIFGGSYGKVSKKLKEVLQKFQTSTRNEIKVVNELLDISQFQLGKEVVTLRPDIEIEPILNEIIKELKPEAENKGIYLRLEKSDKLPKIKADSQKLKVGLFNIIDNAIKYTSLGGIAARLEADSSKLRIIVKDTGIGIPKEELEFLFDKIFERGETAARIWGPGKGIGLFLAHQIIKVHQGRIWAESEGVGKGSTFFVELPIN